jgi:hypothetical protein
MTPRRLIFALFGVLLLSSAPMISARAEDEPVKDEDTKSVVPDEDGKPAPKPAPKPASKKKGAAAKKKGFDYERSKYKSKEPSQTPTYKFNAAGEPIRAGDKKAAAKKKKKRSEPPEMGASESCGSEDACAEKKSEADAL